ncbi:DUF2760 domain-containing protein [Chitinivorax sp. PXF-14]|uniref:DUF2760 domain-containing protein n=1 Tax=Chitinivorax sp. PXF-14 TaxID=3230488 RepID=UPI003465FF74
MSSSHTTPRDAAPGLLRRIPLAIATFFSILASGEFALRLQRLNDAPAAAPAPQPVPQPAPQAAPQAAPQPAPQPAPRVFREATPDAALQLLSLLQRDARLIDFTQENLTGFSDADVGAAARLVHEGCAKVLREHFTIEPVRSEAEGSRIELQAGFDAASIRLTGNVVGQAPFRGSLSHRGWRATSTRLPKLADGHDASVLAPAEVEL